MMARGVMERLGWKPGMAALVVGRPADLAAVPDLPPPPATGPAPFILASAGTVAEVAPAAVEVLPRYPAARGLLWFAYPKRSGAIRTDITRDRGWEPLTEAGFLPVAQVAIDPTWSALRFRRRDEIPRITRKGGAA
jgi:hypothetical protein